MNHPVQVRYLAIGIGKQREIQRMTLCFLDVLLPASVVVHRVH
jgi:hypothetical protein